MAQQHPIDYQFTARRTPTHLHAIGSGSRTAESVRRFFVDAQRAALENESDCLLVQLDFTGPSLDIASIYSIISDNSRNAHGFRRVAYVDVNSALTPERAEFAEMAANKMGFNTRLFRSVAEAERWLRDEAAQIAGHNTGAAATD